MGSPRDGERCGHGRCWSTWCCRGGFAGDADGAAGGRGAMEDEMISPGGFGCRRSEGAEAEEEAREAACAAREARASVAERAPDGWGEAVAGPLGTGNLQHEYAGSDSVRLGGPGAREELISLLGYMKLCMYFSKKPYKVFLEFGRFDQSDVLIKKSKRCFLKPAFTVVRDRSSKCFLLFIRGAISIKERLTAATGADIPFHHVVAKDGCVSNLVLAYKDCGMATAARWIANQAIPCLNKAVEKFPDHRITILTLLLLLSSCCMTWDLAESGKDFITTIVNRNDVVPSLGRVSTAKLHTEVMASSWVHELREQIQQTRLLRFQSIAEATSSEDAHCGVKKRSSLVCWSCSSQKQSIDPAKHNDKEDIKSPLKSPLKGASEGLVKQMELSPSSPSEDSLQLYPPGRILHMFALPAGEEPNTSEQGRREEVVTWEHYMPKYIRTMELLIEKLAKEDMDSDQLDLL
ncbi:hypothetical protein ZWY2020_011429 [Hordeum vulgare]|nr:hypothetical protein ZWY2020_011429 [Hordeum vulgare]